ncbi:MAG: helix-turn-helix domain-containing protein [Methanomassiliicoccaceae archaeon]|jgi:ribosome-binding protein aMBF1 (putative translation factor)|nr:helix-turn-helix domain-containing protein [Methanomassiliicoccaceae archaeon]
MPDFSDIAAAEEMGRKVRMHREALGWSVEELSENAFVDVHLLNDIENGIKYPARGTIFKLSKALGQRLYV